MNIRFPTSPERTTLGEPLEAKPCRCRMPFVRGGACEFCGHWTHATIRATWAEQARRMARVGHPLPVRVRQPGEQSLAEFRRSVSPGLAGVAL